MSVRVLLLWPGTDGAAAGLALAGRIPVVHALATFLVGLSDGIARPATQAALAEEVGLDLGDHELALQEFDELVLGGEAEATGEHGR